jgi:hypothetical protein
MLRGGCCARESCLLQNGTFRRGDNFLRSRSATGVVVESVADPDEWMPKASWVEAAGSGVTSDSYLSVVGGNARNLPGQ